MITRSQTDALGRFLEQLAPYVSQRGDFPAFGRLSSDVTRIICTRYLTRYSPPKPPYLLNGERRSNATYIRRHTEFRSFPDMLRHFQDNWSSTGLRLFGDLWSYITLYNLRTGIHVIAPADYEEWGQMLSPADRTRLVREAEEAAAYLSRLTHVETRA